MDYEKLFELKEIEILNEEKYLQIFNDFINIKDNSISKGKDYHNNYIFISSKMNYILTPPKYRNAFELYDEILIERKNLINKIDKIKDDILIMDYDISNIENNLKNLRKQFNENDESYNFINNKINSLYYNNDEENYNNLLNKYDEEIEYLLNKRIKSFDVNKDEWEKNITQYIDSLNKKFNMQKKYYKNNKNNKYDYIVEVLPGKIKYYKKLDNKIIKLKL